MWHSKLCQKILRGRFAGLACCRRGAVLGAGAVLCWDLLARKEARRRVVSKRPASRTAHAALRGRAAGGDASCGLAIAQMPRYVPNVFNSTSSERGRGSQGRWLAEFALPKSTGRHEAGSKAGRTRIRGTTLEPKGAVRAGGGGHLRASDGAHGGRARQTARFEDGKMAVRQDGGHSNRSRTCGRRRPLRSRRCHLELCSAACAAGRTWT